MMERTGSLAPIAVIGAWLGIRRGEGVRTTLLFVYLLAASAVFILGRTVRDTLFLSRYSLDALPWMFVLYGAASSATVILYSRVADRIPRGRLLVASSGVVAVSYLATYALVGMDTPWIYPVFYVWSEVAANLLIVQFWTLANDLHDPRAARRLFPTIGAARAVGVVVIGLVSGVIVRVIGTAQLLWVLIGLMVVIAMLVYRLAREPRVDVQTASRKRGPPPRIARDRYVVSLALFIAFAFTALTIGDYQFKIIAADAFREDDLARFFSLFYAGTGALALVFQLAVTPPLLRRFGVGWGMSVMPGFFGLGSALLLVAPRLGVATLMKFADNGFQYTVHETSLQALYAPFPAEVKARSRAFLDAVVKPISYGCGGLLLVVLASRMEVRWLSVVTLALLLGCVGVIPRVRRNYVRALERSLVTAAAPVDSTVFEGARATDAMLAVLDRGEPHAIFAALEQLEGEHSAPFVRRLEKLAGNPNTNVKAAALERLADMRNADGSVALAGLQDENASVRAAAAKASAALLGDRAIEQLAALRSDPSPEVRVAVVAGLLEHCGVEGSMVGGRVLEGLLASPDPERRIEAAQILRRLGAQAYRPVRALLADEDDDVRRAALRATEHVADPRLVPVLLAALGESATRRRATLALIAVGEGSVAPLAELLLDEDTPRTVKLAIPRILRAIPSRQAYALLRPLVTSHDGHLRLRVLGALSVLRTKLGTREKLGFVVEHVRFEVSAAYRNLVAWHQTQKVYDTPLLREEFAFRRTRAFRRVLRVLELRYEPSSLRLIRTAIDRGQKRATALEVLDTVIEPRLRPLVVPFFDDLPESERLAQAMAWVPQVPSPAEFLAEECRHTNPFVAACALQALAGRPDDHARQQAAQAMFHREPLVRELALRAMWAVAPVQARKCASELLNDPDRVVVRVARAIKSTSTLSEKLPMYSTLEKVLILKGASLFGRVAAEDLGPVARVAEERVYAPGASVVTEGEQGDELFVVVRGKVAIRRQGRVVAHLGAGEAFGEIAVLDEGPRTASAIAEEETEVLAIGSEEFYEILYEQAEIAEGVIRMLVKRLRDSTAAI